jgi:hypothetical protein
MTPGGSSVAGCFLFSGGFSTVLCGQKSRLHLCIASFFTTFNTMKRIIFSLFISLITVASVSAQRYFDAFTATTDTLINQDTLIITSATGGGGQINIDVPYYYSIHVKADSLSGSNAGFAYLQFSNQRGISPTVWYTAQTMTIDGPGSDEALYEGICYARRVRIYFITPSGTRKVKPHVYASFKRAY